MLEKNVYYPLINSKQFKVAAKILFFRELKSTFWTGNKFNNK